MIILNYFNSLTWTEILGYLALTILTLTGLMVLYHINKRSNTADRVVGMDVFSVVGIAIIAVYAIITEELLVLDVALILALLAFLSTTGFAYYIEKQKEREENHNA
jgi:multicomponent Na+:H+ antiporter subunit F